MFEFFCHPTKCIVSSSESVQLARGGAEWYPSYGQVFSQPSLGTAEISGLPRPAESRTLRREPRILCEFFVKHSTF